MKQLKQTICLVLSIALFFSVLAFAEKTPQQLAAEELNKLSVMVGDETGDLMLGKAVTRAEMVAIICRLSGLEQAAKEAMAATSLFSDVPKEHWAAGYIQLAKQNGIINGYPDGSFLPESQVSYAEVIKMLIAVLGYLPKADTLAGYPDGIMMVATELGLTTDLVVMTAKPAIRSDIALLTYRSLDIPLMMQISYGADAQYQIMENITLRSQYFEQK